MGIFATIGKIIIGGALGGAPGALVAFSIERGGEVIEGTIDVARQIVSTGKDVYRAIPPEAFAFAGMPLHGLLKHEFEDELIMIGELAGEAAIFSGLSWPALGPIGASAAIAEGAVPLYIAAGSIVGKFHHRPLDDRELAMARYIFGESLGNPDDIVLTNVGGKDGSAFVYPSTLGSIFVNLGHHYVHNATIAAGPVLFHELTHVWQARRRSLREVFLYDLIPGALKKEYDFEPPDPSADRQWQNYGTEQQAGIVEAWARGATRRRGGFDVGARSKLAMASPLFRFINGNVRRAQDGARTASGRSVRQLLADGGHRSVRVMHPQPPAVWWP